MTKLLATWFYSGSLPVPFPGTVGSLAALPFAVGLAYMGALTHAVVALLFAPVASVIVARYERERKSHDSKEIVIDEAAGIFVATVGLAWHPLAFVLAFIFFRLFDIVKPWPICWIDGKCKGAWAVVADDILAGLAANVAVRWLWPYVANLAI